MRRFGKGGIGGAAVTLAVNERDIIGRALPDARREQHDSDRREHDESRAIRPGRHDPHKRGD